ncbi:MAG: AAA family ATPase, partial [Acidimicrobiales bacterium]
DEAGMARTDDLAKLTAAVSAAQAKLVLVGDPYQLGAVGPGGMFRTLVDQYGARELETVRRFAEDWEASASLRLRARDATVLSTYRNHGRIEDGSRDEMLDRAHRVWRAAREEGKSVVVTANDNETADELARRCRADRVRRGEVEEEGVRFTSGVASRNDEVVTLRNDRRLRLDSGEFVRNGARWKVLDARVDGSLVVEPLVGHGRVVLPREYVREHLGLAYALTVHKAQGLTVDRSYALVDQRMTAAQFYVAMSRGRETNVALVCSSDDAFEDHARRPLVEAITLLEGVMYRDDVDRSAHEVMRAGLERVELGTHPEDEGELATRRVGHSPRIESDLDHFDFFEPPPDMPRQEGPVLRP